MTAGKQTPLERVDPRRVEWVAAFGLGLQGLGAVVALLMALACGGWALPFLTVQAAIGLLFWGLGWLHLRLRRAAREEGEEALRVERDRKAAGLESLFDEPEVGHAERNLRQMERYLVPAASVLIVLALAFPTLRFFLAGTTPWAALTADVGAVSDSALLCAFLSLGAAFVLFLCGMYAGGLARSRGSSAIRAGGGYMLSTAIAFVLAALMLFMNSRDWSLDWPDDFVAYFFLGWMLLQGIEILCNLVLDIYRPRVAGVESRPAYDSRMSGLLAEPAGLFRTFAHTMDYQFGFKISETWFFHFLERAFMPLVLVWLLTFYLLTCLVVVRQGEVVILECFGAPRGLSVLPADDALWDRDLPAPLGPGLRVKWPWPVEIARVLPRDKVNLLYAGFGAADEADAEQKAVEQFGKLTSWDAEHIADENFYLLPMPVDMRPVGTTEERAAAPTPPPPADGNGAAGMADSDDAAPVDALFLSGSFTLLYRIGARPGDPYRYAYCGVEPVKALRAIFEREITAHFAGANFWDLMVDRPGEAEKAILEAVNRSAGDFGLEALSVQAVNLHPPAGDVGKSFQEVLTARIEKETMILQAEEEQKNILGLIPSQTLEVVLAAQTDRHQRVVRAQAAAGLFQSQLAAYNAAPEVFMHRAWYDAMVQGLPRAGELLIHPTGAEIRLDRTKMPTGAEAELYKQVIGAVEKEKR